eukprot:TRINITY_DN10770_c0_g1_i1.p1 TRINITY_DN10770_c0_g1~~TRINITY_DN10770_c0_g1_i1.p1  ORF type:complete len:283 (+),score=50.62 TRINITY_DN10770_c0_g1_i1:76-849(+)
MATSGTRIVEGESLEYDLYGSSSASVGVIFAHGFGGSKADLAAHATQLATFGAAVLAVNLSSFTRGGSFREVFIERSVRSAQLRNVQQMVDHATWFDKQKLVLVGHSAGGAVVLEAAVALQKQGRPPVAVILLDAVPWIDTLDVVGEFDLAATRLVSIRAEPSAWNRHGFIAAALAKIKPGPAGQLVDLKIPGARHGDPIGSNWKLRLLGLIGTGVIPMRRLVQGYVLEGLGLQPEHCEPVADTLSELRGQKHVEVL